MSLSTLRIETPRVYAPLLAPSRYKGAYGGRGSGKSHFFAEMVVLKALSQENRIVCIRETQKSIRESVKRLLEDKIAKLNLGGSFKVLDTEIRGVNGSLIIFQGMQNHTAESIKSLEGYDIAWVEEAQSLSAHSLRLLRPTIRKEGSELWFTWNPMKAEDPVDQLLRGDNVPSDAIIVNANWSDNPWFPDELNKERLFDLNANPDTYDHVWEGAYWSISDAQIFKNRVSIEAFGEPEKGTRLLYGDLVYWSKANPLIITINLIPAGEDNANMDVLLEANRVGKGKLAANDIITMVGLYPDGRTVTMSNGVLTDGASGKSIASAGRLKTAQYIFAFEGMSQTREGKD